MFLVNYVELWLETQMLENCPLCLETYEELWLESEMLEICQWKCFIDDII